MKLKLHRDPKAIIPRTIGDLASQSIKKVLPSIEDFTNIEEIDIIADDGRTLFSLRLNDDGELLVSISSVVKHNKIMKDSNLTIMPIAANMINISRPTYK